ncbi:PHD finger protein ALFIN-LIKE 1-like [Bidens hawaiensis]|uniref:PHD finger protein ALFIN-LIKE 1-like n=1 Tax=Bidens hawaiensis TaxID=980011 RepID=UPI00404AE284
MPIHEPDMTPVYAVDTQVRLAEKDNLCLYGYPNETWEVTLPTETVPTMLPDPILGINFARDNMARTDWLYLVAVHCDSWLYAIAFFNGADLNATERGRLFGLINSQPTVFEVTREWKPKKGKSSEASSSKSSSTRKKIPVENKSTSKMAEESNVENEKQHEKTLCGSCGGAYSGDEFWIACDVCELWYHGKCLNITPTMAEKINRYECPFCALKRTEPIKIP